MRLARGRRPDGEQARAARRRIAALTARPRAVETAVRSGWVPEVPSGIRAGAADGTLDESTDLRHASPRDASADSTSPLDGSAVLDRLPLSVRAVVDAVPAGVRRGRLGLERGQAMVVVLVVLLGLAVAALLLGLGRPRVQPVGPSATVVASGTPASGLPASTSEASGSADGEAASGELVVHVAGKVRSPGVVRLPPGSRVLDAVVAAGGAHDGVDLTGLNLARLVVDGEQVLVGVAVPAGAGPPGTGAPGGGDALVNLNTATSEELDTLPGIGPTLAARILDWREQHGRFTSVDELQEVTGIGPKTFEELADLATV